MDSRSKPAATDRPHTASPTVAVVGGGLAGLVAARHLAAAGVDAMVYEREDRVGGRVRTRDRDGFRLDRGFQVLFTSYPAVQSELDLDALELRRFAPGACLARPDRRSTLADPLRDPRALPATLFNADVSMRDKLRVLTLRRELQRRDPAHIFDDGEPDVSTEKFLREYGFSDQFIERFAAPFYGGITLDRSLSTSRRVFEYTFRALATGSIAVPAAGMEAIPRQLAEAARAEGVRIETGRRVESIDASGATAAGARGASLSVDGERRDVDAIVVATDPPTAADLTGVDSIPTDARSCVTQYYRLPGTVDLDTDKRLLLNVSESGPNHVVPHSEVAPEYAPADETLLSATYLGSPDATEAELAETTRETLAAWFPERVFDEVDLLHTDRIEFAQFAQPPGVHETLPAHRAPDGPAYLAGDYTAWSSIQGAMASGRRAAQAVVADLNG
ncbi:FAD-dependent oxidoreductase [Natrialbaceae archaeon A-arb3/5]